MSSINLFAREISIKVVYYGPGLGGKTSSLQYVHRALKADSRGQLVSLATGADRTLYFDFLPVKLPKLRGYAIRVQLYTVPGQVHYNSTRKLVLAGADGVVFVADSQPDRAAANEESFANLRENLTEQGARLEDTPLVVQLNKRDVANVMTAAEMSAALSLGKSPTFETVATTGRGIFEALKSITTLVLTDLRRRGMWDGGLQPPSVPPPSQRDFSRDDDSITHRLQALSEAADVVREMEPAAPLDGKQAARDPSLSPLPLRPRGGASGLALSEILPPGHGRDAAQQVEAEIERGDFARAVRLATREFAAAAPSASSDEGPALQPLLLGIDGARYLRFREVARRAESGGVSSADAAFALFFLVDAALRR